ncbi:MAG: glycosyltransferase family 2 protein [Myxococcota bacterium]
MASPNAPHPVSACIIAGNEADRIGACLDSVAFCDEVLVVDSHSEDRTREIAAEHGARVIERDWPGHVAQKEFAIREAKHDWVFCIDADERVAPELRAAIERVQEGGFGNAAGYEVSRVSRYLGRWIRHGTWYPDWKLRLFDRRRGGWSGRNPHDHVRVDGPVTRLAGELEHDPYRSFSDHLRTIDTYTTTMAEEMRSEGRRARWRDVVLRPPARFFVFYVLRRGFLDGWRGLLLAYLAAHYVRLKYAKLWIAERS